MNFPQSNQLWMMNRRAEGPLIDNFAKTFSYCLSRDTTMTNPLFVIISMVRRRSQDRLIIGKAVASIVTRNNPRDLRQSASFRRALETPYDFMSDFRVEGSAR